MAGGSIYSPTHTTTWTNRSTKPCQRCLFFTLSASFSLSKTPNTQRTLMTLIISPRTCTATWETIRRTTEKENREVVRKFRSYQYKGRGTYSLQAPCLTSTTFLISEISLGVNISSLNFSISIFFFFFFFFLITLFFSYP
jgi:hypothetical protein